MEGHVFRLVFLWECFAAVVASNEAVETRVIALSLLSGSDECLVGRQGHWPLLVDDCVDLWRQGPQPIFGSFEEL